jgi:hypothetical protein
MSVLELFCDVDDFMLSFAPQWKASQLKACNQRERAGQRLSKRGNDDPDPFSSVALPDVQSLLH